MTAPPVDRLFAPAGALAQAHGRFEQRRGQRAMAAAVERAFTQRRHLIVEAGTGTGKTLAYLLPALAAGEPVIVSTGTKALQDQLVEREAPLAVQALGRPATIALLKGRENYLCLKRYGEFASAPRFDLATEAQLWGAVERWAAATTTGDRAEIAELPDASPFWRGVDGRAQICTGSKCESYERCFVFRARREAGLAQVVVVNHHLLFADLALRRAGKGAVLPDARLLVLDEAHLAEDAAAEHFGVRLTSRMLTELAHDAAAELRLGARDALTATALEHEAQVFFAPLRPPGETRIALPQDPATQSTLARRADRLNAAWTALEDALGGRGERADERQLLIERSAAQRAALDDLLAPGRRDRVVTLAAQGRDAVALSSVPIDVGPILAEAFSARFDAVVATSATLAVGGSLERAQRRLGLADARTQIVSSPFDHERQAALYVPREFPEPRDPDFGERALREIEALLEISNGRAIVLFASHRALRAAAERLKGNLRWRVLVQGDAPRERLIEDFRTDVHSVLLGTASFRQGIDVPGEALSLVIVDKLPFAVPDDPVVAARATAIAERGGDPFQEDSLPQAILDLRQALGRLIRSREDHGLLAVLDVRVRTRRYGKTVLASLPPWPLIEDLESARVWMTRQR